MLSEGSWGGSLGSGMRQPTPAPALYSRASEVHGVYWSAFITWFSHTPNTEIEHDGQTISTFAKSNGQNKSSDETSSKSINLNEGHGQYNQHVMHPHI